MKEKFQNGLKKVKDLYVGEKKNKYIMITAIALVVVIACLLYTSDAADD